MKTACRLAFSELTLAVLLAACFGCSGPESTTVIGGASSAEGSGGGTGSASGSGGGASSASSAGAGGKIDPGVLYPVPDWPIGAPEDHGLDPAQLDAAATIAEENDSYCLLVFRGGALVYERYWNGHDEATPQRSWSIAKSYTSALVGIAIDRGDIKSLDQSVSEFVPEWQADDRKTITIRNLITMTSGLKWSLFQDYVSMVVFSDDHTQFAVELELDKAPGSEWTYHNGGVQVLERVFRNATGQTIEAYAEQHLWSKLGMKATWAHDPAENPTTYASVMASCRDHARMGYLYRHGGQWAGEQIVPADFVASTLAPSQEMNRAYGYLWWLNAETPALNAMMEAWPDRMVPFAPPDLFAMRGFGNQFVDVIPSLDLMVVRFGPDPMSDFDFEKLATDSAFEVHDAILKPILDAVAP